MQNQYNVIIHEYEETIILNDAYKMSFQKEESNPKKIQLGNYKYTDKNNLEICVFN